MTLLNELNFNFKTLENSVKTVGTIVIICLGIALTVNMFINPVDFTF